MKFASFFSRIFSSKYNPFYFLGSISVIAFSIATITGFYLLIFYKIDPSEAYNSTELISKQWIGGIMRSMHRYSSDVLIVTVLLHLFHQLLVGKFRRFIPWFTGIVGFIIILVIGLTGFILVWDQKAKLIGFLSAKLITSLPLINSSLSGIFLLEDLQSLSGFFRIAFVTHFFLSLFFVVMLYLHIIRISKPVLFPPRVLTYLTTGCLMLMCILFPVISDAPAQSSLLPYHSTFDWYYFAGFYLLKFASAKWVFLILILVSAGLSIIPLFTKSKLSPIPEIDKNNCNACKQCKTDCPYDAISIQQFNGEEKAVINEERCLACGICNASCKHDAIYFSLLNESKLPFDPSVKEVIIYTCKYISQWEFPVDKRYSIHQVPCVGSVHVNEVQKNFDNGIKGVVFVACESCLHRYGSEWEILRLSHKRRPLLESKYASRSIRFIKLPSVNFRQEVEKFYREIIEGKVNMTNSFLVERSKPKVISAVLISLLFSLLIPYLSARDVAFFPANQKMLILNFKYTSSPTETQSYVTNERHMKSALPVVMKRSSIHIKILAENGNELFSGQYAPHGFRKNSAITVYEEILLKDKVKVSLTETDVTGKMIETPFFEMKGNEVITIKNNQFVVMH